MRNATVMNDVQEIQKVLEEYIGERKAVNVAVELSAVMHGESQHMHEGMRFYVHTENGALVLTTESIVKTRIKDVLHKHLKEGDVQECLETLTEEQIVLDESVANETKSHPFETIKIPGSDSPVYAELLKHKPKNDKEAKFIDYLKKAISKSVKEFEVFVNDPSMDNGKLQFVPGFKPAVLYSYNELEKLAQENGLRLGTKDEYILFLGWLITSLINDGWSEKDAWFAVCTDSNKLGHYCSSEYAKNSFEITGSRKVVGKCDLANALKILAKDDETRYFWLAGGTCYNFGYQFPLASLNLNGDYDNRDIYGVGWFVL